MPAAGGGAPGWLLGVYGQGLGIGAGAYYALLWVAFGAYLFVLLAAPAIGRRTLVGVAVILIVAFALAPPLLSQDVFSYISYARLGVVHGLNPYTHAPIDARADPSFPHVGWTGSTSSYGPLFTLATYPLANLSVPAAMWTLKAVAAASVLALGLLAARIAPAQGADPRRCFVFVALNPLVLVHVVGGAHNDATAMLAALAACAAIVAMRERAGGAAVVVALGLKLSAAFVVPFALIGSVRRSRFLAGAGIAVLATAAAGLAAFGMHVLDSAELIGDNQDKVSNYSIPNLLSELLNVGVGPIRAVAAAALVLLIVLLCRWVLRGGDWIRATGWAALGLLLASAWLLPWYVIWALPFAALSRDNRLITAVLALTALQLASRIPL